MHIFPQLPDFNEAGLGMITREGNLPQLQKKFYCGLPNRHYSFKDVAIRTATRNAA
jgi:hypothetical protein